MEKIRESLRRNLYVILIEPQGSGNIGSIARGMKNTGFCNLILIKPHCFIGEEAYWMAYNSYEIIETAHIYQNIYEAIKDKSLIIGTSARIGKHRGNFIVIDELPYILSRYAIGNKIAILFGREDRGLSNEELQYCQYIVTIPQDKPKPSYNLAQAVLLVLYTIFRKVVEDKIYHIPYPLLSIEGKDKLIEKILSKRKKEIPKYITNKIKKKLYQINIHQYEIKTLYSILNNI